MAAVVQARMVRLAWGWQRGAIGKVLAEQSPRGGNEGHIQSRPRFQAQEQSRGEWHGREDNTAVVNMRVCEACGLSIQGLMPRWLLKTQSGTY